MAVIDYEKVEFKRLGEICLDSIIELMNDLAVRRHLPLARGYFGVSECESFVAIKERMWEESGFAAQGPAARVPSAARSFQPRSADGGRGPPLKRSVGGIEHFETTQTRHKEISVRVAVITACLTFSVLSVTQAQTSSNSLVGTWRVVRFCDQDSAGVVSEPMGPKPIGYFIYTPTGQLSIHAMQTPPTGPVAGDTVWLRNLAELRPYYFSYFGTYTITSDTTVTHHVQGGTFPDYIGTDQHRGYRIRRDTLSIGAPPFPCRVLIRVR